MKKLFQILAFTTISSIVTYGQDETRDTYCEQFREEALHHIAAGNVVYKRFGLPTQLLSEEQRAFLRDNYEVEIKQMGCIIVPGEYCYNQEIEQFIERKFGKSIHQIIREVQNKFPIQNEK